MDVEIVKVSAENYSLFQDLVAWRQTGSRQAFAGEPISRQIEHELGNPNLLRTDLFTALAVQA